MSGQPFADHNPYAPPSLRPLPDLAEAIGVGAWRHGTLLVLHEEFQLPPICLKTGGPATTHRNCVICWSHPLRWPREYLHVPVPLAERPAFLFGPGRPIIGVLAIVATLVCAGAIVAASLLRIAPITYFAWASGFIAGVLLVWCSTLGQPLRFVKRWRKYYWLSGAGSKYLAQLPEWPVQSL